MAESDPYWTSRISEISQQPVFLQGPMKMQPTRPPLAGPPPPTDI
jgi:hypothetical protein